MAGKVLFVARGKVIEKDGTYGDIIYNLQHSRGNIACLQNLLPNSENEKQISDAWCHEGSVASVAPLDLNYLKHILIKDKSKLTKLWEVLAYRYIIINIEKLTFF